jgi:ferredoxin
VARLKIDWTRCDGRGLCSEILPELLALDPWGYPVARAGAGPGTRLIDVPAGLEEHADLAIASCPKLAMIKIVEGNR